jgi:uncharacterized protein YbaP (TraB family)
MDKFTAQLAEKYQTVLKELVQVHKDLTKYQAMVDAYQTNDEDRFNTINARLTAMEKALAENDTEI